MTKYHAFFHSNNRLSNWYSKGFFINGTWFNCVEQWMMYIKAVYFGDIRIALMILAEPDPLQQKYLGRKVKGFNKKQWNLVGEELVYYGKKQQFIQNPSMKAYLMSIDCDEFVEASMYDRIWGVGLSEYDPAIRDKSKWRGENRLGNVVTRIRNEFREEGVDYMSMIDAVIEEISEKQRQEDAFGNSLLIDLTPEVDAFIRALSPDVDYRAYIMPVVQTVTECIHFACEAHNSLHNTGEAIRDNDALTDTTQDRVADAAIALGLAMRDKFSVMGLYTDGAFMYRFAGFTARAQAVFVPVDEDPVGDPALEFDAPIQPLKNMWPEDDVSVY